MTALADRLMRAARLSLLLALAACGDYRPPQQQRWEIPPENAREAAAFVSDLLRCPYDVVSPAAAMHMARELYGVPAK